jgi:hypothetical protein
VQEIEDGGDEDVTFWPGTVDTGAIEVEPPCLWVAKMTA